MFVSRYGEFYTDHWVFNNIDYVIFPAGLILSEDEKYLYLTFGYQVSVESAVGSLGNSQYLMHANPSFPLFMFLSTTFYSYIII